MPGISTSSAASILPTQPSAFNVKALAQSLRQYRQPGSDTAATAFEQLQGQLDRVVSALQNPLPVAPYTQITDVNGNVIARVGYWTTKNQTYFGAAFANLWVGPGADPTTAPFFCNGSQVIMGQNGSVFVLDPYANVGAWLGTQSEAPQNVTNAQADGSGQVQLTIIAHGYRNGDWVNVPANPGGVTGALGQWVVFVDDVDNISLVGTTFSGAYTSGGTVNRFFAGGAFETMAVAAGQRITGVVNNGAGLCRCTITAHGYKTGYAVVTTNVTGVPGANGSFLVTVINANTVDLQGSTFTGAYVSGGIALNWPTAKLLAQGDGSLLIQNATISLTSGAFSIVLDPTTASIICTDVNGQSFLKGSSLTLYNSSSQAVGQLFVSSGVNKQGILTLRSSGANAYSLDPMVGFSSLGTNQNINLVPNGSGYVYIVGANAPALLFDNGAIISQKNLAGTIRNLLSHYSDDHVYLDNADGGIYFRPGTGAGVSTVAIVTTAGVSILTGLAPAYALDVVGDINASSLFRVAGSQVIKARLAGITAPSGGATIDSQARTAINSILAAMSFASGGHGLIA